MNTKELKEKLQRLLNYLEQDSNNLNLLISISEGYRNLGEGELAQSYLDKAKTISGNSFWKEQGLLHISTEQTLAAKEAFVEAFREQDSEENRYNLASSLYLNREFEEALSLLNSLENKETIHNSSLLKARILSHLQQNEKAIMLLEELLIKQEPNADVAGLLALMQFDNNNTKQAEHLSNLALSLNHTNYEGLLVQVLLKTLSNEETSAEIKFLLANYPNECRLWFALGIVKMRQMDFIEAEHAFLRATELWPNFYEAWINMGWCQLMQNAIDKAENCYQQAVVLDRDGADGWGGLALVNALNKNRQAANELLAKTRLLDNDCFLADITDIFIANKENPQKAGKLLNETLPELRSEISHLLNNAVMGLSEGERVIH